ncbi:MAG: cobyric acid synthase CobQ [Deltaproteobacteria bacterium]|nr:MAG: cobyric acid synthase CobQ [Deltaproteobacteria bacterium]
MAKNLMILGTGSDVGKSIIVTAICRILRNRGIRVAPFKAQNMSNNSFVAIEGGEIGRAQAVQAEACGILPSVHMNPILLKPSKQRTSQVIVQGKVLCNIDARTYHLLKPKLKEAIMDSYNKLASQYEVIIMEGAGSCCEMNLKEHDIVNFPLAKEVKAKCIIVGDIDRGGVFAQLIGTYYLMDKEEKELTKGFLINKFRGDPALFKSGIEYIEKRTSIPVLGLIPYLEDLRIDPEDSVTIQRERLEKSLPLPDKVNIGVVRLPAISNFTDMEVLAAEEDVVINYLFVPDELTAEYDCVLIPGTKNAMEDCLWIRKTGWAKKIMQFAENGGVVLGICGGFQILGMKIKDPYGIESKEKEVEGIGLLPVETTLFSEKIVRRVEGICLLNNKKVDGYEIHMGRTVPKIEKGMPYLRLSADGSSWEDGWINEKRNVIGTYLHGIMDSDEFREDFLNMLRSKKGLKPKKAKQKLSYRFKEYDRLAFCFERHCDIERLIQIINDE